jgi:hypothetical protein
MQIKEVMRRQYGPMPVWAWTALAASFIIGIIVFRRRMTGSTSASQPTTTAPGASGEFQSGQASTTTDANGNTTTTQYNASGPLTGYPGFLTTQAGPMPYSAGDIYVNVPTTNATPAPPAQQTQTMRQKLDVAKYNATSQGGANSTAPWYMLVAMPGETWKDITARMYGFADNFAKVTDPAAQKRVTDVSSYVQNSNNAPGSTGAGPAAGQVVFFR